MTAWVGGTKPIAVGEGPIRRGDAEETRRRPKGKGRSLRERSFRRGMENAEETRGLLSVRNLRGVGWWNEANLEGGELGVARGARRVPGAWIDGTKPISDW